MCSVKHPPFSKQPRRQKKLRIHRQTNTQTQRNLVVGAQWSRYITNIPINARKIKINFKINRLASSSFGRENFSIRVSHIPQILPGWYPSWPLTRTNTINSAMLSLHFTYIEECRRDSFLFKIHGAKQISFTVDFGRTPVPPRPSLWLFRRLVLTYPYPRPTSLYLIRTQVSFFPFPNLLFLY